MNPRNANLISRYAEKSGTQFMLRVKEKQHMVRVNSIIGLLSCGLGKNDKVTLYCDGNTDNCQIKLLEMQRQFESLA